jgi:excisionase family DNA binding protein
MKLHSRISESKSLEGSSTVPLRTKQQAADYVQCTPRFLERMVRAGRLRAIKLSAKLVRFRQSDLEKFLDSGATIGGGE